MVTEAITTKQLVHIFDKIYANLNKEHLAVFEKEMQKLIPSDNSEIFLPTGADYNDNSINLGVYLSNPVLNTDYLPFNRIAEKWFQCANFNQLQILGECVIRMEMNGEDIYDLDFTQIHFNDKLGTFSTNIKIIKFLDS